MGLVRKFSILIKANDQADDYDQDAGEIGKTYGVVGDLGEKDGEGVDGRGEKVDELTAKLSILGVSGHVGVVLGKGQRDNS